MADRRAVLSIPAHDTLVAGVAFSPDGKWLASAGQGWKEKPKNWQGGIVFGPARPEGPVTPRDKPPAVLGEVKVWDAETGKLTVALDGHGILATAVSFHPAGRVLAAAGDDGGIRLWDWTARQQQYLLRGHTGVVTAVAFSPHGNRLASAGADRTVRLWDTNSGRQLSALQDHARAVAGVAFSPDGRRLASVSPDQTIKLWEVYTGQLLLTLRVPAGAVLGVAFSPDGHGLASACSDGVVRIWDGTPLAQRSAYSHLLHPEDPKGPSEIMPLVPRLHPSVRVRLVPLRRPGRQENEIVRGRTPVSAPLFRHRRVSMQQASDLKVKDQSADLPVGKVSRPPTVAAGTSWPAAVRQLLFGRGRGDQTDQVSLPSHIPQGQRRTGQRTRWNLDAGPLGGLEPPSRIMSPVSYPLDDRGNSRHPRCADGVLPAGAASTGCCYHRPGGTQGPPAAHPGSQEDADDRTRPSCRISWNNLTMTPCG